jgi:hypothetical protein
MLPFAHRRSPSSLALPSAGRRFWAALTRLDANLDVFGLLLPGIWASALRDEQPNNIDPIHFVMEQRKFSPSKKKQRKKALTVHIFFRFTVYPFLSLFFFCTGAQIKIVKQTGSPLISTAMIRSRERALHTSTLSYGAYKRRKTRDTFLCKI